MSPEDRAALGDLVARYAQVADSRDPAAFAPLFTEDGTVTLVKDGEPEVVRGPAQIVERLSRILRYDRTYHFLGQQTVELAGDGARGETYCLAHHLSTRDDGRRDLMIAYVRYQDHYVRDGTTWRFGARTIVMDWTERRALDALR
ncbi:MAG TPA: nuclear transport factor 2 family protein [Nocardioidaceae bacterium]